MRLLDLYCGEGGAAMGYFQAGFTEIVGVDTKKQKRYPFTFVQSDALDYLEKHGMEFDLIHTSPPCQRYSRFTPNAMKGNHPDLIAATREMLMRVGLPFVIENVPGARHLLHSPIYICGSMVGLPIWRHRYFEIYPPVPLTTPECDHNFKPVLITDHGGPNANGPGRPRKRTPVAVKREAAQVDWVSSEGISDILPPAYTRFIGQYLLGVDPSIPSSQNLQTGVSCG